ncbi:MAG: acyl-CoA synthetase, partial [Acidobacteriota bacterium]|nr:acyl-CoA synthetase [Acidobacteriota bacterium]
MTAREPAAAEFNLGVVNEKVAAAIPERTAIVWGDRRVTFARLTDRSRRLASLLHDRGLGLHTERADLEPWASGQDHLGIYLFNGNEFIEGMLGA